MDRREMEKAFTVLRKRIGPQMVGWSEKIRQGKVRIYVSEMPTAAAEINEVEIAGEHYGVEYVQVGEIRILR